MPNNLKKTVAKQKLYTLIGLVITAVIAISAIVISLFQQGRGPLAPTAPQSEPAASTIIGETCTLTFNVASPTPTPADLCITEADVVLALDRSGSMNWLETDGRTKLEWEKQAAISFVQTVASTQNTNINIGVVSFGAQGNDGTGTLDHLFDSSIDSPLSKNYEQIIQDISEIEYIPFIPANTPETCISCGLGIATQELIAKSQQNQKAIILLSDGQANRTWTGNLNTTSAKNESIQATNYGRGYGITYHVLGYGKKDAGEIDEDTLKQIANIPEYYQYKPAAGDWESAFLDVFDQLCLTLTPIPSSTPSITPIPTNTIVPTLEPTQTPSPTPGQGGVTPTPTPSPVADLSVIKTVDEIAPVVGGTVTYTITVTNSGPDTATGVVIADVINPPNALAIISAIPTQGIFDEDTGLWTVGTILPDQSASLTIRATVLLSGEITNLAEVKESDQDDPDSIPDNNTPDNPDDDEDDEDTTTIIPVEPTPTPTMTPAPTSTPTATPAPTNTIAPSLTPSVTPTGTLAPTTTPACLDIQSQLSTPACITCPTCVSTINWQWTSVAGATEYQIDIYNSQAELIIDNDWRSGGEFGCESGTCKYSSSHSLGAYYAVISAQGDNACFNTENTESVNIELCDGSSITPTIPQAGSTGPTVMLFGIGAVAVILGILGFLFVF